MAQNKFTNTKSEFLIYCQETAMKVHSSSNTTIVTLLRRGPESLSHWTRTVNMVDSSKQIKTLLLDSFCWHVREFGDIITPSSPNFSHSFLQPSPISQSYEKQRAVRADCHWSSIKRLKTKKGKRSWRELGTLLKGRRAPRRNRNNNLEVV